jgi:exopolyphosphatase/guanosine-5'-triphosphate,3'-diphosphate pyrophosphatase
VQAVNLGRDVFSRGMISPDSTSLLCGIMKDFAAKTVEYGVGYIRAFATSAVREAFNREIFINNIKIASGIDLEILEGSKEAALITMAVKKALGGKTALAKANLLLMGIGTGRWKCRWCATANLISRKPSRWVLSGFLRNTVTRRPSRSGLLTSLTRIRI